MTNQEKRNIKELRNNGMSYREIAALLNLSENTVSSYCKRHGLGGRKPKTEQREEATVTHCLECGCIVQQVPHRKAKKFCSNLCRTTWWNAHPKQGQTNALKTSFCPVCGEPFKAYKSANQKYCSRRCYGKSKEVGCNDRTSL